MNLVRVRVLGQARLYCELQDKLGAILDQNSGHKKLLFVFRCGARGVPWLGESGPDSALSHTRIYYFNFTRRDGSEVQPLHPPHKQYHEILILKT